MSEILDHQHLIIIRNLKKGHGKLLLRNLSCKNIDDKTKNSKSATCVIDTNVHAVYRSK